MSEHNVTSHADAQDCSDTETPSWVRFNGLTIARTIRRPVESVSTDEAWARGGGCG